MLDMIIIWLGFVGIVALCVGYKLYEEHVYQKEYEEYLENYYDIDFVEIVTGEVED